MDDGDAGFFTGMGAREIVWLYASYRAKFGEHGEVTPRAAANLRDEGIFWQVELADGVGNDRAARAKPPVLVLD